MKSTSLQPDITVPVAWREYVSRFSIMLGFSLWLAQPGQAATLSWSGGSLSSGNWSDSANWGFVGAPASGDTLIFPAAQPQLANTNNIIGLTLNQIRFVGASGGYAIRGNSFTLTDGIAATNTAGANTIYNNISLSGADAPVNVGSAATLTLRGNLSGSVGLAKSGPGVLHYSGINNTYSGTTTVNDGALELETTSLDGAFDGPLVIGDTVGASASAVVRLFASEQIPPVAVTIRSDGRLDQLMFSETIGNSLTMNGGSVLAYDYPLVLTTDAIITLSSGPSIYGFFNVGSGTCTIQGSGSFYLYAQVRGTANIVKNDSCALWLMGVNIFTGTLTANTGGYIYALDDRALGATNGGTIINNSAYLAIGSSVNITNEALTMNTTDVYGIDVTSGTNTWWGPVTLSQNTSVYVATNSALEIIGPISGVGGITKWGAGRLRLSGDTDNLYSGPTVVEAGLLELNKSSFYWAIGSGSLTVGDDSGGIDADIVRYTGTGSSEINAAVPITLYGSGLLDLNGRTDSVGALTFYGGDITTGAGQIQVYGNLTAGVSANTSSTVSGELHLANSSTTFNVADSPGYDPDLSIYAVVTGGEIIKSGAGTLYFNGNNTYTGLTQVRTGKLMIDQNQALGSTGAGTVVSNGAVLHAGYGVDNIGEPLTVAGNGLAGDGGWVLEGTLSWDTNITLSADTLINCIGPGNTATINGAISGAGGFTKIGVNPLMLTGPVANSYAGTTHVLEGRLDLNKSGGSAIPYPHPLVIGGTTNAAEARALTSSQTDYVRVDRSGLLNLNGFDDYLADLELLNGGDVETGAGTVRFVSSYGVTVANPLAVGSSQISGHLELGAGMHTFLVTNGGTLTVNAEVSGAGALAKGGPEHLYLVASNAYTGLTVVQDGFLWVQNAWALGTPASGTVVSNGASLVMLGSFGITNEVLTLNGAGAGYSWGALDSETTGTNFWSGPITLNADSTIAPYGSGTHLRLIGTISGAGGLTKGPGSGTLYLDGNTANTYGGTTRVNLGTLVLNKAGAVAVPGNLVISGTARLARSGQIADSADVLVNNGALFDFDVYNEYFDTLRGGGTVNFGTGGWIWLGLNGGSSTFDGPFTGVGYAPGWTVGKTGTGTFTMNGNHTFTAGHLRIQDGTVLVNGAMPQSPVMLDNGAVLGGGGTVGTISGSGRVAPGTSAGCLTSSNLTFTVTGSLQVDLGGTTACSAHDQLIVRGTNILANASLQVTTAFPPGEPAIGDQFIILNNDGAEAISGTFNGLPNNATLAAGDVGFRINYNGGDGNDVVLTVLNAPGASVTINATDRGWYDRTGYHDPGNQNYYVGANGYSNVLHNWFVFTVPAFTGTVVQAELLINCYSNVGPYAQETYVLRHVSTPIATLRAGGSGFIGVFGDLANGPVYGVRHLLAAEEGERAILPLNLTFMNDLTAAAGGQIALGGEISTQDPAVLEQSWFGWSGSAPSDIQLRLTFGTAQLVNAFARGWYDKTGLHNAGNSNYVVGEPIGSLDRHRNFFAFGLPAWSGHLANAQLWMHAYTNGSPVGWLPYQLHDVSTSINTLTNTASGATAIYADLADGGSYGGREVFVAEQGTRISVPLHYGFIGAATANRGGAVALGGSIPGLTDPLGNEYLFSHSNLELPNDVQLWLGFVPATVPSSVFAPGSPAPLGGNRYEFALRGTAGTTNEIQASPDLENWDVVRTLYMSGATTVFNHTNSAFPYRYFRARLLQ